MKWHRGPTHGPLGVIGLGLVTAALVWGVNRWRASGQRGTGHDAATVAPFVMLAGTAMLGVVCHVLMDFPTSYGTRLFSPFDWHWYAVDWMPIIDVYLLMALAAGLVFGRLTPEMRRHNVAIALTLMAGNYVLRGAAHSRAVSLGPRLFGQTLPQPCDHGPAPTTVIDRWPGDPVRVPDGARRCLVDIAAMPTFLSPFTWRVIAQLSNAYEVQDVNVLDRRFLSNEREPQAPWRTALRVANQWTPAVAEAARAPTASIFLGFSRFPAARATVGADGITTVRWTDMRFAGGVLALNQPPQRPTPFGVIVQVSAGNQVMDDRLER